jgi:hypothetical protein
MAATSQSTTSNNWTIVSLAKKKSPYKFLEQQLTKLPVPLMLTGRLINNVANQGDHGPVWMVG